MKSFISTLLFLLAASASSAVCAQTVVLKTQSKAAICSQESFDKAEDFYNRSKYSSELLGRAERELKEITADCADYSWSYQAEIYLRDVQERAAERNFLIARYCWGLVYRGRGIKTFYFISFLVSYNKNEIL